MPEGFVELPLGPQGSQILAVHAALLPSGEVLYFAGSEHDQSAQPPYDSTRIWNPGRPHAVNRIPSPQRNDGTSPDLFCCGHTFLPNGNLFIAGGTAQYETALPAEAFHAPHFTGIRDAWLFVSRVKAWKQLEPMQDGRWYPTCTTLPDDRVFVISGHASVGSAMHENKTFEIFTPGPETWSPPRLTTPLWTEQPASFGPIKFNVALQRYYPRLHVLPNGKLFNASALQVGYAGSGLSTAMIDYIEGTLTALLKAPHGKDYDDVYEGPNFSSVLLPLEPPDYRARILACGGKFPRVFDMGDPDKGWQIAGGERPYKRRAYGDAVLLPNGKVLMLGGSETERRSIRRRDLPGAIRWMFGGDDDTEILIPGITGGGTDAEAVRHAEIYDPNLNTWEIFSESRIPRVYHSVHLLLPDGTVWIAGSNHNSERGYGRPGEEARELTVEIYSPPYMDAPSRPTFEAINVETGAVIQSGGGIWYGGDVDIRTAQAQDIRSVALLKCGSVTHAFNFDQRYIKLQIDARDNNHLRVTMPRDTRIAPHGYYMLFIVDGDEVPSEGQIIQLTNPPPVPRPRARHRFVIPRNHQGDFPTGVRIAPGESIEFAADGEIIVPLGGVDGIAVGVATAFGGPLGGLLAGLITAGRRRIRVSPSGLENRLAIGPDWPSNAANEHALLAKVGTGPYFYVGRHRPLDNYRGGELFLRINSRRPQDNTAGEFHCYVDIYPIT